MTHSFLFIMSLSGSVVLLLYILIYPISKKYFSLAWRYRILKIAIAFYLIPFPICFSWLRVTIPAYFPQTADILRKPEFFMSTDYGMYMYDGSLYVSSKVKVMFIILLGIGILSFSTILLLILRYWKVNRTCLNHSHRSDEQASESIFYELKRKLGIKRNVKLFYSEYCKSPFTMGILSPMIIIPPLNGDEMNKSLYQNVLKHELVHIKHKDLLIKFLGLIVIAVHWFNPFAYILYYEISNISEMYCDSIVLNEEEEKTRKEYSELLLQLATKNPSAGNRFIAGIMGVNSKIAFKRRILEMKTTRKNKTILSIVITVLICMAGGLTVCAYDAPANIEPFKEANPHEQGFDYQFTVGKLESEELPYEHFFIDDAGNLYEINTEKNASKASCTHKYISGAETSHKKISNGGCTITTYESQRCSFCGYVKRGKEISTLTYKTCPH